ncbi:ribonuclease III [Agromyces marinus]|uniref:Ribonuclease 3 n=1 Tax=Agromyces marinus TaxID=1389020 RepID=A0ABM8H5P0_9MICO|nr:ribonuclease III [Agromyces marinus]UIP58913.1 Ribonuclease 3 [Agromyces marinus]BDZ56128.1 ribonuclease 3 [Agromyces marinus]
MRRAERTDTGADELAQLQRTLGVELDPDLLLLALTHRSFAYENGGIPTNERLEFLGDSILGQAVTVRLFTDHPELDEGELAKRRASLVSSAALAEVARTIGIGRFIRLGRGETMTGGADKPSILADTVEAIIGAVFLSRGGEVATEFVLSLVAPLMDDPARFGAAMDPKTSLQEIAARRGSAAPAYSVSESGPDHNKHFVATVVVGDLVEASGEGSSKKQAEMAAALRAWTLLSDR